MNRTEQTAHIDRRRQMNRLEIDKKQFNMNSE